MFRMLFITEKPEGFKSNWGAWFSCVPHEDGWIVPLGWERELMNKGVSFTEIEITTEDEGSIMP